MKTTSVILTAGILASTTAFAKQNVDYDYAKVVGATPITEIVRVETPRRECWNEEVAYQDNARSRSATPVLLGSIIGGVLGNEIGHSKDARRAGTVAGVLLGGSIGRDIGRHNASQGGVRYATEEVCKTYQDVHEEEKIIGYDVQYKYRGSIYDTQTPVHPGERIKVRISVTPVNQFSAARRYSY